MTDLALENNIFMLNERNEHERTKIKRILKSQWLSDYAPDIFQTMKESESHRRPVFFTSTELNKRPILIQLCHVISRTYKLGHCAQHLGVFYMDRYLDYNTVESEKLQLIALTCMHIAAQIENTDINVPRYSEMNRLIKGSYTSSDFKDAERKVLKFFDFKLIHPTVASFVEMFAWNFITNDDYISYCKSLDELDKATAEANAINYPRYTSFEQMLAKLALVLMRMSDYTLNINNFINKPPSLLAASCIAATRKVSGLPKRWTPLLTELTSYDEQAVEPFVNAITECHYIQELSNLKLQEQQQQQQQQFQLQQEQQFQLHQQPQLQVQQQPQLQVQQQVQQPLQELNWNSPDSGFGDSLTPSQLEIVSLELQATAPEMEVVSVEVETFSVITVKLQAPRTGTLKRNLDNNNNEEDEMQTKRLKLDEDQLYP